MKKIIALLRFLPVLVFYPVYKNDKRMQMDADVWAKRNHISGSYIVKYAVLLTFGEKAFRNLFIYRLRHHIFARTVTKIFFHGEKTLFIETEDIGGGLFIQHGFATMIAAKKIGEYCWINQQVTIGYTQKGCPTLGDKVYVTCGAKVLGDIEIGNNVMVAANAAVVKSFPEGFGVLGGVPAKLIKKYNV